ncbi:MAG: flagellar filament capping protein FliD [Catonella sp.]|uniref:flagellar filament capping protein FliD n=1 Tax=Catonella sp. TaxID=2382125 RepID=UPI003FA04FF8
MGVRLSGLNSGMDTEAMIKKIMDAHKLKLNKVEGKRTTLDWKKEKWKELNSKLYSLYTNKISALRFGKAYTTKKVTSSDENVVKATGNPEAVNGSHKVQVKQTASAHSLTGDVVKDIEGGLKKDSVLTDIGFDLGEEITFKVGDKEHKFTVDGDTTVGEFLEAAKKAGLNANFDSKQQRFYFSAKETGEANKFSITESKNDVEMTSGLEKLGLAGSANVTKVEGKDAIFRVDGTEYKTSTNTNNINGLNLTLTGTTADYHLGDNGKSATINANTDVESVYNNFKSFLKDYNSILKEMNELYYAGSAKGYDPLTSEQKKGMSAGDVEAWEKKIKDSLLRRDTSLGKVLNAMKTAMQTSVNVGADEDGKGGKRYSLASFGVMTSTDYKERGLLHMYGDSEDGVYSAKEDKLKKALTENPEETAEALKGIMETLYNKMTDAMKGTGLSSAMTFYNDKEMNKLSDSYKKEYNTLEAKINKIEDKYYKQFAAMEKAMAKMNAQNNSLASLLGK